MKTSTPHYFHCATKGFDHSILFADVREFVAGMNRIGIYQAHLKDVIVIAFCLMDNHVHFILYGTREDCLKWMAMYHRLTMIWQSKHREGNPIDEEWEYDAWRYDLARVLYGFQTGGETVRLSASATIFAESECRSQRQPADVSREYLSARCRGGPNHPGAG